MSFITFFLVVVLVSYCIYMARFYGLWGLGKGTKKAKEDTKEAEVIAKKRTRATKILTFFVTVSDKLGRGLQHRSSYGLQKDLRYRITRLNLRVKILNNRTVTMQELHGMLLFSQLFGLFLTVLALITSGFAIWAWGFVIIILTPQIFRGLTNIIIRDQDTKLENDFPDLYFLLYNRLKLGAHANIRPTLNAYLVSLDLLEGKRDVTIIRKFVTDLLANMDLYADEMRAILSLRDTYTSVMLINFCNLAVQSLRGVNNKDKLLSFKIELTKISNDRMEKVAQKRILRGTRATYLVYVILVQFIILSWASKLGLSAGSLTSFFGK